MELAKIKDGAVAEPMNKLLSNMFGCLKRAMHTVKTISEGADKKPE